MTDDPQVRQAGEMFQLGLLRSPAAGRSGELLGKGAGNSLEFQEYRQYVPGDDIRHVDWSAYARSDTLMVRLFREDISPRTEILLDASVSMTSGGEDKPRLARQLAAAFAVMSARLGGRPAVIPLADGPPHSFGLEGLPALSRMPLTGRTTMPQLLEANLVSLKKQSLRIVISDFLFPHDPAALLRRLAREASALWVVQVLNPWEADPTPLGGRRLIDVETGLESDLVVDRRAIAEYLSRLSILRSELLKNCRRLHGLFAGVVCNRNLLRICQDELCAAGMLRPA